MDWETFQMSAVYIVGIMSNVSEHEDVGNNTSNREPNNSTANNSTTRPWNTPNYSVEQLAEAVNPDSFKIWKNDTLPSNKVIYSNLIRFIPQLIRERIGKETLNSTRDLKGNLNAIEEYMLKAYPMSRRRLDFYNLLNHNNQTKYIHMIQNTVKASRECNYSRQSAQ